MTKQTQKLPDKPAKHEPPVSANDLLAEIEPLLEEYFLGEITIDSEGITYRLPNGQTFLLTAKAAA